jgi:hypothetical protein
LPPIFAIMPTLFINVVIAKIFTGLVRTENRARSFFAAEIASERPIYVRWLQRFLNFKKALAKMRSFVDKSQLSDLNIRMNSFGKQSKTFLSVGVAPNCLAPKT